MPTDSCSRAGRTRRTIPTPAAGVTNISLSKSPCSGSVSECSSWRPPAAAPWRRASTGAMPMSRSKSRTNPTRSSGRPRPKPRRGRVTPTECRRIPSALTQKKARNCSQTSARSANEPVKERVNSSRVDGSGMTETQGDLAALSRFVFRAPQWYASLAFALALAALAGVAAFDSQFVLEDAWQGVFFIGVPTVVASVLTPPVDRRLGGQLPPNRASLLALVCEAVLVATLVAAGALAVVTPLGQRFVFDALSVGLAAVLAVRLLVLLAV